MPFNEATGQLESLHLTPTQRKRLYEQVKDHYAQGKKARGDMPARHDEYYRRYRGDPSLRPQGPWPNAPRLFTGDTRSALETILAQLWKAVFPGFDAITFDALDTPAQANRQTVPFAAQHFLRYLINDADLGGWAHIGRMALFDALCNATGFVKVYAWRPPFRRMADAAPDTIIRIDNVDEETLFFPSSATGLQYPDAAYVGQECFVTWDALLRKRRQGFTVPPKNQLSEATKQLSEVERTKQEDEGRTPAPEEGYLVVEQYERFVLGNPDTDEEDDVVVSWYPEADYERFLGRMVYLTDLYPNQQWPTRPFFSLTVWTAPRKLHGFALPERLRSYQDMTNRLAEQMVNYGDVSILPFFFYNALITGDIPDLRQVMPGQGVPVNDLGGIQAVPRASLNQHFIQQMQYWRGQIEQDTHVSDPMAGRTPQRPNAPRTLGGTMLLLQQGREAFSDLVIPLGYQYSAMLNFWWRLWQRYLPPGLRVPMPQMPQSMPEPQGQPVSPFFDFTNPLQAPASLPGAA